MSNDIGDEMQDAFVVEDFDMMKKLIFAGSSPNSADRRDGSPIILRAAVTRDLDMINFLIGQQADVDSRGPKGLTALHAAALYGFVEILQRLIEAGSDTNAKDAEGATPFVFALASKDQGATIGMAKILIAHGADKSVRNSQDRILLDVYKEITGKTYDGI